MNTRALLISILAWIGLVISALAGGDSFEAEILSFTDKGDEEYRMEIMQYSTPYGSDPAFKPHKIVIHLRFYARAFGLNPPFYASREKYREAIDNLKEQAKHGGHFQFGIMADGYTLIKGTKNEFQSNTLCIMGDSENKVVYSFSKKV